MADGHEKWNNDEIASHLKSAVEALTPNVLDRIDLSVPQMRCVERPGRFKVYRRMRSLVTAAAACLCVAALCGGVLRYQNTRVETIIGLDVNPSIELSVNRKDRVLEAEALNEDGEAVLADMDLEGVDLNIAVNAVIGSMVRCGYLDELDNAILVTVANDDTEKAAVLRQDVVTDIETTLEAHKVSAVVYDQQATDAGEISEISEQYGISYGKACFLYALVEENGLSEKELEKFAGMSMEEIAAEIAERAYQVGGSGVQEPSTEAPTAETATEPPETQTEESSSETTAVPSESQSSQAAASTTADSAASASEQTEEEKEEEGGGRKARIDYVDYYEGVLDVTFEEKVKWKNPTVSVQDSGGGSYSAKITDTGADSCSIEISGLTGGESYTFILNGVKPREGGAYGTVKGYFDAPDISEGAMGNGDEESSDREDDEEDMENGADEEETGSETGNTETGEGGSGEILPKPSEGQGTESGPEESQGSGETAGSGGSGSEEESQSQDSQGQGDGGASKSSAALPAAVQTSAEN